MSVPELGGIKSVESFVEQLRLARIERSGGQRAHARPKHHGLKRFALSLNFRTLQEGVWGR